MLCHLKGMRKFYDLARSRLAQRAKDDHHPFLAGSYQQPPGRHSHSTARLSAPMIFSLPISFGQQQEALHSWYEHRLCEIACAYTAWLARLLIVAHIKERTDHLGLTMTLHGIRREWFCDTTMICIEHCCVTELPWSHRRL
ncbi:MAG: hypothetical protein E6J34_19445 [Chloroflexi bacterium]|nr:MAG: hypothetical protein E6J34_19445 [Chloroflexota bacterium]